MKTKLLTLLTLLLTCVTGAWADSQTIKAGTVSSGAFTYSSLTEYTYGSDYWVSGDNDVISIAKNTNFTFTNAGGVTITGITVKGVAQDNNPKSSTITISDNAATPNSVTTGSTEWTGRKTTTPTEVNISSGIANLNMTEGTVYTVTNSNNNNIAIQIIITYTTGGGGGGSYTVTYKANGGTGDDVVDDEATTVAANTFTAPDGKVFAAWNTAANGSGVEYAVGASVTSDLTLFAQWEDMPTVATPTFRVINGTVEMSCETEGATIKYSTNGVDYTTYTIPVTFLNRTTVYAKAVKADCNDSEVYSQTVAAPAAKAGSYSITLFFDDTNFTKSSTGTNEKGVALNDVLTGKAGTDLEGYVLAIDNEGKSGTSNFKELQSGSNINDKKSLKNSNGRPFIITLPEGIKVNRITLYSYTNGSSDNNYRTTWTINGTAYTTSTMVGLSLRDIEKYRPAVCNASNPDVRVFTMNDVSGSFTLNNSGYQQCFYMVLDYTVDDKLLIAPAKEYTSFCSDKALDFTNVDGLEAYAVTAVDTENKQVTMTKVTKVPASEGLILKKTGEAASYEVPTLASADAITNKLVGVTTDTEINNVSGHKHYILSNGSFIEAVAGSKLAAGKAYLDLTDAEAPDLSTEARGLIMVFDEGETTGIKQVEGLGLKVEGYYNLNGQRVAQPTKGLYIVNGKKVIIK